MRSALVVGILGLAACGSSQSSKPPVAPVAKPTAPVAKAPAAPVVDEPRLVLARKVMAALAGGETEALVALAEPATPYRVAGDCTFGKTGLNLDPLQTYVAAARLELGYIANKTKGLKLEVLGLANQVNRTGDADTRWIKKGAAMSDKCTAKQDLLVHDIQVKIRAQRDAKPAVEQTVTVAAMELDGRWYLMKAPMRIKERESKTDMEAALKKMSELADRMCKCADKACAEKVQEELTSWSMELTKDRDYDEDRPDPDQANRATQIMIKYSDCASKLLYSEP
jgi:hypothetical protein